MGDAIRLLRALAAIAALGLVSGCGADREVPAAKPPAKATTKPAGDGAAGRLLTRNGISIAVPTGWDARMLFRDPAGAQGVIYQVANFRLPPNEGFQPPHELPPGQQDPIKAMGPGDVIISVIDDRASGEQAPRTIALGDLRFLPAGAPAIPRGHALAEASFCYSTRCIQVESDFGGGEPAPRLRNQVDVVLASIAVK
jgi:hypothetical protein